MAVLTTVAEFRAWAGVGAQVSDEVIAATLDEAEAAITADVGTAIEAITANPRSLAIAHGEELRRANRLLARKNSPEGIAGAGEQGLINLPSRDPDSQRAVWAIQSVLMIPEGVA